MKRQLGDCPLLCSLVAFSYDPLLRQLPEAIHARLYDLLLLHFNALVALIQIQAISTFRGVLLIGSLVKFILNLAVVRRRFWVDDIHSARLVAQRLRKTRQMLYWGYLLGG